jgi:putative membrane protein
MWNCNTWAGGPYHGMGKFFMGFGPFGGLLSLFFVLLLIYLAVRTVRSFIPSPKASSDREDSLGILKNRLAKGEISQEEYHRMREILMS